MLADILARHTAQLMARDGVEGVFEGLTSDNTPCIRVLLSRVPDQIHPPLPQIIEGFPVRTEVTGKMRPLRS